MANRRLPQTRIWATKPLRQLIRDQRRDAETYPECGLRLALDNAEGRPDIEDPQRRYWDYVREFERDTFADKNSLAESETMQSTLGEFERENTKNEGLQPQKLRGH